MESAVDILDLPLIIVEISLSTYSLIRYLRQTQQLFLRGVFQGAIKRKFRPLEAQKGPVLREFQGRKEIALERVIIDLNRHGMDID